MIKLSLLLPTYNRMIYIQKLLEYLKQEDIVNDKRIEIIISNNASHDDTKAILDSFKGSNIQTYNQKTNIGLINNIRFLVEHACGEYVWIMGDNDIYYPGAIREVLNRIMEYGNNIAHYFINYNALNGSRIMRNKMYNGEDKVYKNGLDMIYDLTTYTDLGVLMFISANVFRYDILQDVHKLVDNCHEEHNLALPLGYSLYAAKYITACVGKVYVSNNMAAQSTWSDSAIKVYCRDMIAIYDVIAQTFEEYPKLRKFLIQHLPTKYPEYKYLIKGRKFIENNYAMEFYRRYYPHRIILDIVPFLCFCIIYLLSRHYSKD